MKGLLKKDLLLLKSQIKYIVMIIVKLFIFYQSLERKKSGLQCFCKSDFLLGE